MFLRVSRCMKETDEKSQIATRADPWFIELCIVMIRSSVRFPDSVFVIASKFSRALIIRILGVTKRQIRYLKLYIIARMDQSYINCETGVEWILFCARIFHNANTRPSIYLYINILKNCRWSISRDATYGVFFLQKKKKLHC